jgi:hypothetical protein
MNADVSRILRRRAELTRELAALDDALALALEAVQQPDDADEILDLAAAARHVGEPASTFRQRPCYRRALVSGTTERRLRYSRLELDRILRDRLAAVSP